MTWVCVCVCACGQVPALTAVLQLVQDTEERPSSILFYPVFETFAKQIDALTRPEVKVSNDVWVSSL